MDDKIPDFTPKAYEQLDGHVRTSHSSTSTGPSSDAGRCSVDWSSTNGRKDSGNHADHQWQYEDFSSERISSRRKSHCLTHAVTCRFVSGPEEHFDLFDDSSWQSPAAIHHNRVEDSFH